MDRPIPPQETRKRRARQTAWAVAGVAALSLTAVLVSGWLRPAVSRDRVRTAVVERGTIEATVSANGRLIPTHEQLLTSPTDSRVLRILRQPGDALAAGEPVLELDESDTRLAIDKLTDRIALQRNQREQARVELAGTRRGLGRQSEIKEVELRAAEQELKRNQTLFEKGLITEVTLESFVIDVERARIELRQLEEAMDQAEDEVRVRFEGLDLEIAVLEKDLAREQSRLQRCRPSVAESGVLTWVVPDVGTAVQRGDELARVADLGSYRVEATLSDVHASTIAVGLPARVRVGGQLLVGKVTQVRPRVENGVVTCEISLDRPDHPDLRHNLRVDVHIVTDHRDETLLVRRGSFPTIDGEQTVYVLRDERLTRTPVRFGLTNFEHYEILDGVEAGDVVVLSDMSEHSHLEEVSLR